MANMVAVLNGQGDLPSIAWSYDEGIQYIKQIDGVSFRVRYKAYCDARSAAEKKGHKWVDARWAEDAGLSPGYVGEMAQGYKANLRYSEVFSKQDLRDQLLKASGKEAPKPTKTPATVNGRDAEADVLPPEPEDNNVVPLYAPKVTRSGHVDVPELTANQMAVTLMSTCYHEITANELAEELDKDFGLYPNKMSEFADRFEATAETLRQAAILIRGGLQDD